MNESPVLFGEGKSLVGIVSDPEVESNGLGFVFLNAGFTHHVGPQRMHVQFARQLARAGYTCLRFDYSGIGDSPRRSGSVAFADRAIREAVHALDFLESSRGIRRCAVFGICWGADNAIRLAEVDARVVGVVAVDFYAVMSTRYFLRFYARRLLNPASWINVFRGKSAVFGRAVQLVKSVTRSSPDQEVDEVAEGDLLPVRSPEQIRTALSAMVERGVHLAFAYATVGGSYDRYLTDFRAHMQRLEATGRLRVKVFGDTDHVFTLLHSQAGLWGWVEEWARALAASAPAPTAPA